MMQTRHPIFCLALSLILVWGGTGCRPSTEATSDSPPATTQKPAGDDTTAAADPVGNEDVSRQPDFIADRQGHKYGTVDFLGQVEVYLKSHTGAFKGSAQRMRRERDELQRLMENLIFQDVLAERARVDEGFLDPSLKDEIFAIINDVALIETMLFHECRMANWLVGENVQELVALDTACIETVTGSATDRAGVSMASPAIMSKLYNGEDVPLGETVFSIRGLDYNVAALKDNTSLYAKLIVDHARYLPMAAPHYVSDSMELRVGSHLSAVALLSAAENLKTLEEGEPKAFKRLLIQTWLAELYLAHLLETSTTETSLTDLRANLRQSIMESERINVYLPETIVFSESLIPPDEDV